jgi:hypothetical protein
VPRRGPGHSSHNFIPADWRFRRSNHKEGMPHWCDGIPL